MIDSHDEEGELQQGRLDPRTRRYMRRNRTGGRVFFSVFLICVGVILFLVNLGVLPVENVWRYWPVFPIGAGLGRLLSSTDLAGRSWGVFVTLAGVLFLLSNLGVLQIHMHGNSWPFALLLIGAGVVALINASGGGGQWVRRRPGGIVQPPHPVSGIGPEDGLNDFVLMGVLKRKVETAAFRGGEALAIFGNIELDLRRSQIPPEFRSAIVNVQAVFAGVKVRVPDSWRVHLTGAGILGNFEDKTIPPNTGRDAPTLIITGFSIFSSVEIED